MTGGADAVGDAISAASAVETARIVSALIRVTGDWDLAEDCVQDAFARALIVWRRDGVPDRPGAWLTTVARNRAIDVLRRRGAESRAAEQLGVEQRLEETGMAREPHPGASGLDDDRLRLIYTCCHPALGMEARVALTLRTVAGLTVAQIARAFLVAEATMDKRLVRARARIRDTGIPYRVPPPETRAERTDGVLAVLYLLFNEGYSSVDPAARDALQSEAVRLASLLHDLLRGSAQEPESLGLLALMRLHGSRAAARTDADGALVTLEQQDRTRWDRDAIDDGLAALAAAETIAARVGGAPGRFQLQAAIAAEHARSAEASHTDFAAIAGHYARLARLDPSPVVELNRAVAVAMSEGLDAGLAIVTELERDGRLDGYHLLPATRADLLRRMGRHAESADAYSRAADLAPTDAERDFLAMRALEADLAAGPRER